MGFIHHGIVDLIVDLCLITRTESIYKHNRQVHTGRHVRHSQGYTSEVTKFRPLLPWEPLDGSLCGQLKWTFEWHGMSPFF